MKQNRKLLPLVIYGSWDAETPVEALTPQKFNVCTNMYPIDGVMKKRGILSAVSTPITSGTYTGLKGVIFQGSPTLFRMYNDSGNKIDKSVSGGAWSSVKTGLTNSDTLRWSITKYWHDVLECVLFTNDNDQIQVYNGTTCVGLNTLVTTGTKYPSKAKIVLELDGYLVTMNICENDTGIRYKNRIRWCEYIGDEGGLKTWLDDSFQPILSASEIYGAVRFNTEIYIFTESGVHRMTPTGDTAAPFSFTYNIIPWGTKLNDVIQECKNKIIFYSTSDNTVKAFDGFKSVILSEQIKSLLSASNNLSAGFDGTLAQYILQDSSAALTVDFGTPLDTEIATVNWSKETYPGAISFLCTLAEEPYCIYGNYVAQMHATGTQDIGSSTPAGTLTTGYYNFGDRMEAKIGKIRVYGKELSGSGTTTVTLNLFGPTDTVTEAINLSVTGTDIQVNRWARQFQLTFSNTANQTISVHKVEMELLNMRNY